MNPECRVEELQDGVRQLLNEVDCRIEHGAQSGGHLEYVRSKLKSILGHSEGVAECDLNRHGYPYRF